MGRPFSGWCRDIPAPSQLCSLHTARGGLHRANHGTTCPEPQCTEVKTQTPISALLPDTLGSMMSLRLWDEAGSPLPWGPSWGRCPAVNALCLTFGAGSCRPQVNHGPCLQELTTPCLLQSPCTLLSCGSWSFTRCVICPPSPHSANARAAGSLLCILPVGPLPLSQHLERSGTREPRSECTWNSSVI